MASFPLTVPTISYGFELERFELVDTQVAPAEASLTSVLIAAGLDRRVAQRLERTAHRKAEWTNLEGFETVVFGTAEGHTDYVAQVINGHQFLRIDTRSGSVSVQDRDGISLEYQAAALYYSGNIDSMLAGAGFEMELERRVKSSIADEMPLSSDFTSGLIQLVYTVKRDEAGHVAGYGDVEAMRYQLAGEVITVVRFSDSDLHLEGFFQPDGSPVLRSWLASPVPGGIVSSPFNLKRLHPVLQFLRPHYGTDYAAPYGTPILAVSDGVVVAQEDTRNNGNFVKIRHDDRYQTQYLHMKAFARGIRPGVAVKKGQVIGYIGSTGLSSGPHVCFRLWKDGEQVDPAAQDLHDHDHIAAEAMSAFEDKSAELAVLFGARA